MSQVGAFFDVDRTLVSCNTGRLFLRDLRRRVGNETSGLGVKAELYDRTSPWEGVRTTLGT